jgi:predicted Rossmann fold flavoprotein
MLLQECLRAKVHIDIGCEVRTIEAAGAGFRLATSHGLYQCEALVVATGGLSVPSLGGSGFGYELARQFGLQVLPCRPGLVPFTFTDAVRDLSSRLSGLSVPARISTGPHSFTDSLLFTHRGLSGPAVLQLSSYWQPGDPVVVNLFPHNDAGEFLNSLKRTQPRTLLRTGLSQHLPKNLIAELETLWWPGCAERAIAELPGRILTEVADRLHGWELRPAATEGYRTAEVTVGGVDTRALSSRTMASRAHPGLYFIGEVLDVTGHLGGFNFQWAWSSGYAAGLSV